MNQTFHFSLYSFVFYLFMVLPSISLLGCVSVEDKKEIQTVTKKFKAKKETAWEALLLVLKSYPKKNINKDAGTIETEMLRALQIWQPVGTNKQKIAGLSYTIKISLAYRPPYTHATIQKTILQKRDFFSKSELLASDLLEEQTLLYRLGREIKIKKLTKKLFEKGQK